MSSVGRYLFSKLVLPALAVQAQEQSTDDRNSQVVSNIIAQQPDPIEPNNPHNLDQPPEAQQQMQPRRYSNMSMSMQDQAFQQFLLFQQFQHHQRHVLNNTVHHRHHRPAYQLGFKNHISPTPSLPRARTMAAAPPRADSSCSLVRPDSLTRPQSISHSTLPPLKAQHSMPTAGGKAGSPSQHELTTPKSDHLSTGSTQDKGVTAGTNKMASSPSFPPPSPAVPATVAEADEDQDTGTQQVVVDVVVPSKEQQIASAIAAITAPNTPGSLPATPSPYNTVETTSVVPVTMPDGNVVDHFVVHEISYTDEELREAAQMFYHRLFAEALGTWVVTFFHAGLAIQQGLGNLDTTGHALAAGLVFVFLIYSLGAVSGAHLNPVVTWAFVIRGIFPFYWLPFYWVAQITGGFIASLMLWAFWDRSIATLGTSEVPDSHSVVAGFLMEALLTFVLVFAILCMASRSKIVGPHAALAIAAVIGFNVMFANDYSSASMNPFRSLCMSIVLDSYYSIWAFIAGPFMGATIAVIAIFFLAGRPKNEELSAGVGATIARAIGNAVVHNQTAEAKPNSE